MTDDGSIRVRPQGRGFAAEGRGFYVWDADRGEVLRAARELGRARGRAASPVLLRVGARGARAGRPLDPGALDARDAPPRGRRIPG